jgi:hypothetical protein
MKKIFFIVMKIYRLFKGVVAKNLVKIGGFNGQLPDQYKLFDKIRPSIDIFEQKSCIPKKTWLWQMAPPIRNKITKLMKLFFKNVSPAGVFNVTIIYSVKFLENYIIWLQHYQKTLCWLHFRGLIQNVFLPWILNLHIRNLHECIADESVKRRKKSLLQIRSRFFINRVSIFQKLINFNEKI